MTEDGLRSVILRIKHHVYQFKLFSQECIVAPQKIDHRERKYVSCRFFQIITLDVVELMRLLNDPMNMSIESDSIKLHLNLISSHLSDIFRSDSPTNADSQLEQIIKLFDTLDDTVSLLLPEKKHHVHSHCASGDIPGTMDICLFLEKNINTLKFHASLFLSDNPPIHTEHLHRIFTDNMNSFTAHLSILSKTLSTQAQTIQYLTKDLDLLKAGIKLNQIPRWHSLKKSQSCDQIHQRANTLPTPIHVKPISSLKHHHSHSHPPKYPAVFIQTDTESIASPIWFGDVLPADIHHPLGNMFERARQVSVLLHKISVSRKAGMNIDTVARMSISPEIKSEGLHRNNSFRMEKSVMKRLKDQRETKRKLIVHEMLESETSFVDGLLVVYRVFLFLTPNLIARII